ncbi:lactate/malate dehydrogenase, NAD Hypothetical protein domain [Nesidiocoris tenuis]|uniref:Cytochrome b5 domain-containing protein 1 n=1 Tax=Nesidiocoris tenuis TaxID=355587 RepID=A0ABN7AMY9_9HEMI|nr:lactate/malate dehydrogenase, NAD Hypothetical protein domain [Nesidiocoris tenuis]
MGNLPRQQETSVEIPAEYRKLKYIKPSEVVVHNQPWDCWISARGIVKDLTPLVEQYMGTDAVRPILAHAGKDISHWFDKDGDLQTFIHPVTGLRIPYLPHGCIPHVNYDNLPHAEWTIPISVPWWKDDSYNVARITSNVRPVRIFNVSAGLEIMLHVCEEETINQIKERYQIYNSNASRYTWKFEGAVLNMDETLTGNNIRDLREKFRSAGLSDYSYVPCLMLSYNDDFKSPDE